MRFTRALAALAASVVFLASASADVTIGQFTGGVAEPGWGRFNNGVQPLDSSVYTVSDLGGGALETNLAGFHDSMAYSFSTAGTKAAFFANDELVFDMIYRGTATDSAQGGFSQVFQVVFQSNNNSFAFQAYQTTASGASLAAFGNGGSSAGWAAGDPGSVQTVANIAIDYRSFKNSLPPGFDPSTLQFWLSTNDSNRVFKAIDNVHLIAVPEPTTLCGVLTLAALGLRRRSR